MLIRSYKYRIYPDATQAKKLAECFGCVRWFWNNSLELSRKVYEETGKRPSRGDLSARLPGLKAAEETSWLADVPSQALQMTLINQEKAFQAFFAKRAKAPQFKNRFAKQSFSLPEGFRVEACGEKIRLPKFLEGIPTNLHRKFVGKIKTGTVSKTATGKYYISLLVEEVGEEVAITPPNEATCLGIDLGIKDFAVSSDETRISNPKFLSKKLKKLRRAQRKLSRRKKDSNRRIAQRKLVARQHEKVASSRLDFHHQLTRRLVENQNYGSFAVEDLGIKDMMGKAPKSLARQIGDAGWFQFRTILTYKASRAGKAVIAIDRFAASSKTCSCGCKNESLKLTDREWTCRKCGVTHDRDLLAAKNIKRFAFANPKLGREPSEVTRGESEPLGARRAAKNTKKGVSPSLEAHSPCGGG